jgi:hypothetical protein
MIVAGMQGARPVSQASEITNVVSDWAGIVQPAIHNASVPRPPASSEILHAMIQLAVYDAAIAIEGGYEPYAGPIAAPPGADVRAAVATAAYRTARARVHESQYTYLDERYETYLAQVADGPAKDDGIRVGEDAATALLALRAGDGFDDPVQYHCSANPPPPGEFEPDGGCGTQPVDAKVARITPFTFKDPSHFRPDGPTPLRSKTYGRDFIETRDYGRENSMVRTPEQTDISYFWSEHTYVHWNRNLIRLAVCQGLNVRDTARFLAMAHTAAADAVIAGFEAKYHYRFWRPRTAIPRADTDPNPNTEPDPRWTPLLTVNHPEYPSAHAFWSTALTHAIGRFFGTDKVTWTIVTDTTAVPQVIDSKRTYDNLNAIVREINDARIWPGLHWRHSMRDGNRLGRKVAEHVFDNYFQQAGRPSRYDSVRNDTRSLVNCSGSSQWNACPQLW